MPNNAAPPVFVFSHLTDADEESFENYGEKLAIPTPAKFIAENAAGSFKPVSFDEVADMAAAAGCKIREIFGENPQRA